jgi:ABC-type phosphate transport system substrate-binding protein
MGWALSRRWFLAGGLAAAVAPSALASVPGYKIIVHSDVDASAISKSDLARMFLKQTARWPDGTIVRPADLNVGSDVRVEFTEEVIGRTVGAVRSFWQAAIFSGRGVPPPELDSDAAVVAYVSHTKGAIGYVSPGAETGDARVVEIR